MSRGKQRKQGRTRDAGDVERESGAGQPGDITAQLVECFAKILELVGASSEPSCIDLHNTPERMARMLDEELLSSYKPGSLAELSGSITLFDLPNDKQEMIVLSPIPFVSMCAHHMLPFVGDAHIGYIPQNKIVGLSKLPRVVDHFSRKLQIQERMTSEIADFIDEHLSPMALIVYVEARHLCMEARGVRKPGIITKTSALRGIAKDPAVKSEFYTLINKRFLVS